MKKIISSILIAIVVLQLFAPFSVVFSNKKIAVEKNQTEAVLSTGEDDVSGVAVYAELEKSDKTITIYAITDFDNKFILNTQEGDVLAYIKEPNGEIIQTKNSDGTINTDGAVMTKHNAEDTAVKNKIDVFKNKYPDITFSKIYKKVFTNLTPEKTYTIAVFTSQAYSSFLTGTQNSGRFITKLIVGGWAYKKLGGSNPDSWIAMEGPTVNKAYGEISVTTSPLGQTTNVPAGNIQAKNVTGTLPPCGIDGLSNNKGTIVGCIAQGLYYLFFKTTSAIFGLAGVALDFTVMYSISDASYRSTFVVEGWGIVRDFCNMFFIFVLLYIAFGTILNIHSVKTKEMIVSVVIIGLLMNFSLFATQVIIDTSNILTRVFYNQNTIVVGAKDPNTGKINNSGLGEFGELKLSTAIISKADPQKLILQAEKVNVYTAKNNIVDEGSTNSKTGSIDAGTFILVVFLATAVNVVGIIVFLSCAIIFITRVIGLWLAMILVPFAFFSYTVPALQSMEMVGWKHWWPETLKLAFLAPVFAFFMYIIVGFLDKGLDIINASDKTGLNFLVAIVVPFILIMVLLMKAKKIATDMSGEIGKSITNGIQAVGGIALGGAAGGAALLLRKGVGATMARASRGDTLSQKFMDPAKMANMNWAQKAGGWVGSGFGTGKGLNVLHDKLGDKLNEKQKEVGKIDHARHITDEAVDKGGFKGKQLKDLSATQQDTVKTIFVKDNKSKWAQEEEDKFRKGKGMSDKDKLKPADIDALRSQVTKRAEDEFAKEVTLAAQKVNIATRAFTKVNTGSFDVRNISELKSDRRESFITKGTIGLAALIATGVRGGIRGSGFGNSKVKVEGDFMKDLGNTISDSLKSMKVNVDLGHVGEHKSSADAHGGDAGGGGHH